MGGDVLPKPHVAAYRKRLEKLRQIFFANIVMAGEIPSPSGQEDALTDFLSDRFTECGLDNISFDESGNVAGVISGRSGRRNILVAAHVDKIWSETDDHTVSVGVGSMSGRGIADNGLGVAALATLPLALNELSLELDANVILLGATKSFGRGNLGGMRFFLENTEWKIDSALCVEGMQLGRLSFASLGMARGEISVSTPPGHEVVKPTGVLPVLSRLIARLDEIDRREGDDTTLFIGSVESGTGYNVPPVEGLLRFEIRSPDAGRVIEIENEIVELVRGLNEQSGFSVVSEMIAHRKPGRLSQSHPLVVSARSILGELDIEVRENPSISELAPMLDRGIPALTLGVTSGSDRHLPTESIELAPAFSGLAQLIGVLETMDTIET